MKLLLASTVLLMALYHLRSAIRPEVSLKGSLRAFTVPMAVLLVLALGSLIISSPSTWEAAIRGETLLLCVTAIPLLSLPTLTRTLWVLRKGAVSDPFRCGLLAGLLAMPLPYSSTRCIAPKMILRSTVSGTPSESP